MGERDTIGRERGRERYTIGRAREVIEREKKHLQGYKIKDDVGISQSVY